ncbi:MAG: MBL fold metallo-hydrolase [Bryobacterales bacterium]|nr:MBL fold metallo-hydrolase [Bryobacterales bacterium]MBV9399405.1 MBL fold metallo-hydrolase [Bryobacterales bacterium]
MRRLAFLAALFALPSAFAAKTLDIYFIDVEGGQSTLVVSPSGQSLLIDAGYTGFGGRDADRIAKAAKAAGVKRIDYLLITHFHSDHVGGVPNLLQRLPVSVFLDHGGSIEDGGKYPDAYAAAIAKAEHRVVVPGDSIAVKSIEVTVVTAAGKTIERKGEANPNCAGLVPRPADDSLEATENSQSAGVLIQFGKFRFGDFGDITWNKELALLCPENRVGKLDLFLSTHHGGESPKAIWALAPRVAIMNNGPRKGGDAAGWRTLTSSPGLEDLWQLHFAIAGGKETNVADSLIANVEENDSGQYIKVSASADGSFTVLNTRNKHTKTYVVR